MYVLYSGAYPAVGVRLRLHRLKSQAKQFGERQAKINKYCEKGNKFMIFFKLPHTQKVTGYGPDCTLSENVSKWNIVKCDDHSQNVTITPIVE